MECCVGSSESTYGEGLKVLSFSGRLLSLNLFHQEKNTWCTTPWIKFVASKKVWDISVNDEVYSWLDISLNIFLGEIFAVKYACYIVNKTRNVCLIRLHNMNFTRVPEHRLYTSGGKQS